MPGTPLYFDHTGSGWPPCAPTFTEGLCFLNKCCIAAHFKGHWVSFEAVHPSACWLLASLFRKFVLPNVPLLDGADLPLKELVLAGLAMQLCPAEQAVRAAR